MTLERTILSTLINDEEYCRKVIPYLKAEYFQEEGDKKTFTLIDAYLIKYNKIPSLQALMIDLQTEVDTINEHMYTAASKVIEELKNELCIDQKWLIDHTEKFCQERAIYLGIYAAIDIMDDKTGKKPRGSIPKILHDALAVSFDTHVGLDVFEDSDRWYENYHRVDNHIPFDIDKLNDMTKGGVIKKTLNVFLAGTNVGKTLAMCHMASVNLVMGYNVLYITMEMAEEKITERIYANLLDESLDVLSALPKPAFDKKIDRLHKLTKSRLIVKEFPTACAGVNHFRHLLNELRLKKNFIPDIIYVDYINICMSSRLKLGSSINSYLYVKAVAEELRGLAVEFDVPVITATQTNREGSVDSDFDMTATSDSFGLPMTADLLVGIISTEDLEKLNQYMFKTLKNRYNDATKNRRFVVGVDRSHMRLYNIEESAQNLMKDDTPVMDVGPKGGFDASKFADFK